jgi:outer membrane immunogenic protein
MRKQLVLSAAVFIVAIASASAADLPVKAQPLPPPPSCTWCGFYIGVNAGGKWARVEDTLTVGGTSVTFDRDTNGSWVAGGQLGYNWQAPGSPWVFGIEGDIDAQDFNRSRVVGVTVGPFVAGDVFSVESRWQASLRGRIGYAAWDRALLYVTGGAAFTNVKATANLVGVGVFSADDTRVGGTVGVGLEYALWNRVSLGIEGRWSFYGDDTFNTGTLAGTAVSNRVNLDTAEVTGRLNFRF